MEINKNSQLLHYEDFELQDALDYLSSVDPDLKHIINVFPRFNLCSRKVDNLFNVFLEGIIYQQLTAKAASMIYGRLCSLFSLNEHISPFDIIRADDAELKATGMSKNKIEAIRNLAQFALSSSMPEPNKIKILKNSEFVDLFTQIKGVGPWTAKMILIFVIGRADVTSSGDFSLRKGLSLIRGTRNEMSVRDYRTQSQLWSPFRSIASWYLWRAVDYSLIKK